MSLTVDLISAINTSLDSKLQLRPQQINGLTELIEVDTKTYPVQIGGTEGVRIVPSDAYAVVLYWRQISDSRSLNPDRGYGSNRATAFDITLRLFGIGNRKRIGESCGNVMWDLAATILDALPKDDEIAIAGNLQGVQFEITEVRNATGEIIEEEFRGHNEKALNALLFAAFSIDISFSGTYCGEWCDIGAVTVT